MSARREASARELLRIALGEIERLRAELSAAKEELSKLKAGK